MRKRLSFARTVLVALIGVALIPVTGCASHSLQPTFQVWKIEGAVAAVDASSLHVRHKSGQVVELQIDERTTYLHNKQPASKDLLIKGTRVIVEIERRGGVDHALRVEIFEGARKAI